MHKLIYTGVTAPKDTKNYLWQKKDKDGNTVLCEYNGRDWTPITNSSGGGGGMIETTYADLVDLRDSGSLSPGTWYRITDYVTITSQYDTHSEEHQFDVLVLATSSNTLSEQARAIAHGGETTSAIIVESPGIDAGTFTTVYVRYKQADEIFGPFTKYAWAPIKNSEGKSIEEVDLTDINTDFDPIYTDTETPAVGSTIPDWTDAVVIAFSADAQLPDYFKDSNLEAWQLQYCLDNDESRFGWAGAKKVCVVAKQRQGDLLGPEIRYYRDPEHDYIFPPEEPGDSPYTMFAWTSERYVDQGIEDIVYEPTTIYVDFDGPQLEDANAINELIQKKSYGSRWLAAYDNLDSEETTHYVYSAVAEGKGVIYRMVDEYRNDCPYDFKNIYTFVYLKDGNRCDYSLEGDYCHDNTILPTHIYSNQSSSGYDGSRTYIPMNRLSVEYTNRMYNIKIAEDCIKVILYPSGENSDLVNLDIRSGVANTEGWGIKNQNLNYIITIARGNTKQGIYMYNITDNMTTFITPDTPH